MKRKNLIKNVEKNITKFIKSKSDELVMCNLTFIHPKTRKMTTLHFAGKKFKEEDV